MPPPEAAPPARTLRDNTRGTMSESDGIDEAIEGMSRPG